MGQFGLIKKEGFGFGDAFGSGATAPVQGQLQFDKTQKNRAFDNADIWHAGFNGSIFQIVSDKIDKNRDQVNELEWDTPLNRALSGLPAKKKQGGK